MSIYAIYLNQPNDSIWKKVKKIWPGQHMILDDHLAFVAPEGITTTRAIAESSGIREGTERGLVLDVSAYSGYNRSDLWEWLSKVEEQ